MTPLWQRLAVNPESSLQLLDAAFWLKFAAYRDRGLRAQLSEAWSWCFRGSAPSRSLAPLSNRNARDIDLERRIEFAHVGQRSRAQPFFPETDRDKRMGEAVGALSDQKEAP